MNIQIPITIFTKKIPGKQDSIFYAGKTIAEVKVLYRTYVLTTAGEYLFNLTEGGRTYSIDSNGRTNGRRPAIISRITDKKIRQMDTNDLIGNWGWFGINIWVSDAQGVDHCMDFPTDAYSGYDEALKAFINFVEKNLTNTN